MKLFKKTLALCIVAILVFSGCSEGEVSKSLFSARKDTNKNASIVQLDGITEICSNENFSLQYDKNEGKLDILDKKSYTKLWSTGITEAEYGKPIMNKLTAKALRQIINVKYTDFGKKSEVINNLSDKCETVLREIDDGIRMDFVFSRLGISLSLDFILTNSGITVSLPRNSIKEEGQYAITSIDVLPMFGATLGGSEGYFLVPDGCGAIYRFDGCAVSNSVLTLDIYDDMLKQLDIKNDKVTQGVQKVSAPVFGISHSNAGVFANITEGAENCSITLQTDQSVYAVNRIYPVLNLRKQYFMNTASGDEVSNYEKTSVSGDLTIEYTILNSDDCGYSAMANVYRNWLLDKKLLDKKQDNGYEAAIDFLVGVEQKSMLNDSFLTTASFEDIDKTIKKLNSAGVKDITSILYGWQKNGYFSYPPSSKVSSAAGGKRELKELVANNKNTTFYMLQNYLKANINTGGFSKYSDVVYKIDNIPLTDESEELFLLNPKTQFDKLIKDLKTSKNCGAGIAFEGFGSMLYEDYEKNARMSRESFVKEISTYLNKAENEKIDSAADGFAPYTIKYAKMLFNLPDRSSEYLHLDETVPFLQMVLHGYINYSSPTPGNLSNDLTTTKLKWVEYGYMPTFMLTCENSDRLEDTSFNLLFTSGYDTWGDKITQIYTELKKNLSDVADQTMLLHQKQDGIAKTTYSDGTVVIVNYNTQQAVVDGVTVNALDYAVIK